MLLIVVGEQIIGSNRIFGNEFGAGRFKADKGRVGDQGAERAVEATGGTVAILVFGMVTLLVLEVGSFPGLPMATLTGGPGTGSLLRDQAE